MKPSWVLESPMHRPHITVDQNSAYVASDGDTGLHPNQITFYLSHAPITTGVDLTYQLSSRNSQLKTLPCSILDDSLLWPKLWCHLLSWN